MTSLAAVTTSGPDSCRIPRRTRKRVPSWEQGLFFDERVALPEDIGTAGRPRCAAAGITYRQLDYWARTGLVEPSIRPASGSGTQRLYSFRDVLVLKIVKRLLDTGVSLQQIRTAVSHLRERGVDDLAQITLMSDGASVYECTSADEVIDLVQGGQGVFGIAVGRVWREVEGTLPSCRRERGRGRRREGSTRRRARRPAPCSPRRLIPGLAFCGCRLNPPLARRTRGSEASPRLSRADEPVRESPTQPAGAPKEQPSPEPLRPQDRVGEAPLESGSPDPTDGATAHRPDRSRAREPLRCR